MGVIPATWSQHVGTRGCVGSAEGLGKFSAGSWRRDPLPKLPGTNDLIRTGHSQAHHNTIPSCVVNPTCEAG